MSRELLIILTVVVPDGPSPERELRNLHGRELPGVPGSWVTRVGIRPLEPVSAAEPRMTLLPVAEADDLGADRTERSDWEEEPDLEDFPDRDPGDVDRT